MKTNVLILLALFTLVHVECHAQVKLGAIGDSLIDEHFDQEAGGVNLGYSMNALELMVANGKIDAGPLNNWGGTRGTGYGYNWSLAGATSSSLISDNQHVNLANQIPTEGITKAVLLVGANDLFPYAPGGNSAYENIYNGTASASQIASIAQSAVDNVVLAAQTLESTGVDLIVATAPDYGIAPYTKGLYTNPVHRERVDDVIELWNAEAVNQLTHSVKVPVVDLYSLTKDIWGDHGSENATFELGGVALDLDGFGAFTSDTANAFVHDGIHPNNAIGGIFANLFMTAFNEEYGDNFLLFSEEELLLNAGPNLGALYSSDTFNASLGGKGYSDYVISPVPEPTTLPVLMVAIGLPWGCRRRRSS